MPLWGLQDHPRTRGEKGSPQSQLCRGKGSPPHTRGKVHPAEAEHRRSRITPAHAGKSVFIRCGDTLRRDHPRTRGEKHFGYSVVQLFAGSPPHTRGKGSSSNATATSFGITPAHAGKSFSNREAMRKYEDHPRTRGEKYCPEIGIGENIGSPPHTRGKVHPAEAEHRRSRITPAHAGKSAVEYVRVGHAEDHPRTRGEK